jgi:hypothetical protein
MGRDIVLSGMYQSVCDLEVIRHQKETQINMEPREFFESGNRSFVQW